MILVTSLDQQKPITGVNPLGLHESDGLVSTIPLMLRMALEEIQPPQQLPASVSASDLATDSVPECDGLSDAATALILKQAALLTRSSFAQRHVLTLAAFLTALIAHGSAVFTHPSAPSRLWPTLAQQSARPAFEADKFGYDPQVMVEEVAVVAAAGTRLWLPHAFWAKKWNIACANPGTVANPADNHCGCNAVYVLTHTHIIIGNIFYLH